MKTPDLTVLARGRQDVRKVRLGGTSAVQPALLSLMNEQAMLRLIQAGGPASRIEVARRLGITAPTASKAADSLLQAGWLEECDDEITGPVGRGRPAKQLQLPGKRAQVIGVVLDAQRCQVVASGLDGVLQSGVGDSFATPRTYEAMIDRIAEAVQSLTARAGVTTFGLGISLPGLVDPQNQRGILSPNLPLTDGRSPARDIGQRFPFPCIQMQEEHALCLAERTYGSARGGDDFAMIDVSTGVGLGIVSGGRLLTGHRGLAGELGHITVVAENGKHCGCGNDGCLETEVSETALSAIASERLGRAVSIEELAHLIGGLEKTSDWHDSAEADWAGEMDRFIRYLSIGVATVINLFNVSSIFIHSTLLTASPSLFRYLVEETGRRALSPSFRDCQIVLARGNKSLASVTGILEHLIESRVPLVER